MIAARALRTFGYGCTSVLLAQVLIQDGEAPWQTGVLLAVASVGSVAASLLLGLFADRWGRRRVLIVCGCLMASAGVVFTVSRYYPALLLAALVGTISPSTNDNTPFSGVEQAILAQNCELSQLTGMFTLYNVTALAAGALGGLAAAVLGLQHEMSPGHAAFAVYALLAICTVGLFLALSPAVEAAGRPHADKIDGTEGNVGASEPHGAGAGSTSRTESPDGTGITSRIGGADGTSGMRSTRLPRRVRLLAALFAVDAFAGGLVVQAVLAWWFAHRYGASIPQLGLVFFAANLLPALAQLTAPMLAARRGLLTAMLVPHFVSNLLLASIAFAPGLGSAVVLLLLRQTLSKIDVPARQAFTAAIVEPPDRTAAASMTSIARSIAVSISPIAATTLFTGPLGAIGAPLLLGAALAIGYDVAIWRAYRSTPLSID